MRNSKFLLASAIAGALCLAGCGRDDASLLSYVPADTPYVMANLEPLPQDTMQQWMQKFAPFYAAYGDMLAPAMAELEASPAADPQNAKLAKAFIAEMSEAMTPDGLQKIGVAMDGHFALYGIGLAPVFRWELKDEAAFRALVARVETRLGEKLGEQKLGGASYWRAGPSADKLMGVVAIADGDVVVTLAPRNADEKLLRALIGLDKPSDSLDPDVLEDLNDASGYLAYGSGYVDTVKLAERLLDDKTGVEKAFLDALSIEEKPVDPTCREEFLSIARNFPRATFGYTALEPTRMDQRMLLEVKPALAKDIAGLAAPVPGLGAGSKGTLLDFGMSLDLTKLPAFVSKQAAAFKAKPYACESLVDLNTSFADMDTQLSNPMVMAAAPVFSGFRAVLTEFKRDETAVVPEMAGTLVVASPNPQSLIALARTTVPALASLKPQPGGEPVALPAELATPGMPTTYVAVTDKAIGFAVGEAQRANLTQMLTAAAGSPPPLFVANYSGSFMGELMTLAPAAEIEGSEGSEGSEGEAANANANANTAQVQASVKRMADAYATIFDHFGMTIVANDRGIEMRQEVTLK